MSSTLKKLSSLMTTPELKNILKYLILQLSLPILHTGDFALQSIRCGAPRTGNITYCSWTTIVFWLATHGSVQFSWKNTILEDFPILNMPLELQPMPDSSGLIRPI